MSERLDRIEASTAQMAEQREADRRQLKLLCPVANSCILV